MGAEVIDFIVTGSLFAVFYVIGLSVGKSKGRKEERAKKPKPAQPICPCEHVWGAHKNGGSCQSQVRRPFYYSTGSRNGHEWVNCACTKYHGPEVINSEFFNPGTYIQ